MVENVYANTSRLFCTSNNFRKFGRISFFFLFVWPFDATPSPKPACFYKTDCCSLSYGSVEIKRRKISPRLTLRRRRGTESFRGRLGTGPALTGTTWAPCNPCAWHGSYRTSAKVNCRVCSVERQRTAVTSERERRTEEKPHEQSLPDRVVLAEQQQPETRERPENTGRPSAGDARLPIVVGLVR